MYIDRFYGVNQHIINEVSMCLGDDKPVNVGSYS